MRILHLSDIHFRAPQCLDPATDRDRPYRTRLKRDLAKRTEALGSIDAILVGGDIAYQADPREYVEARQWLIDLAAICGCDRDSIWVVPGNHDVNRKSCEDAPTMNAHAMIATADDGSREWMLEKQLSHSDTGQALFHGHLAYNDFASKMNCQVYPGRLYWKQERDLGRGVKIRIHGLTSTLLSGRNGKDDPRGALYLSPLQTTLDPAPNVVNLTICHHPPDWLIDGDDVEDMLNARAMFQVFGHKHRQRISEGKTNIRWSAGAVNPSRSERQFEPGYNIIELEVLGEGAERRIDIRSHLYKFQTSPEAFYPIRTDDRGDEVHRHSIPFPVDALRVCAETEIAMGKQGSVGVAVVEEAVASTVTDAEASMGDKRTRHLVDRFWDLDGSDRREIALELGLITKEEVQLPEAQRYGVALIRAAERNLIDRLDQMVAERE
ncbi:metallophosphoesterase [Paraburkholderia flava]|uniref:metallophosphoesterase n=1 Tax=Paraburkholderia flava TaxID=2547393 RepID=UPI00105DDC70|nr:metallophosphoesterase [Paraburkholderia flava]